MVVNLGHFVTKAIFTRYIKKRISLREKITLKKKLLINNIFWDFVFLYTCVQFTVFCNNRRNRFNFVISMKKLSQTSLTWIRIQYLLHIFIFLVNRRKWINLFFLSQSLTDSAVLRIFLTESNGTSSRTNSLKNHCYFFYLIWLDKSVANLFLVVLITTNFSCKCKMFFKYRDCY